MTERTFTSASAGPVVLGLDLPVGSVRVQVLDSLTSARVVLRTKDASGPAADAVAQARSRQDGQALAIEVPEMSGDVSGQSTGGIFVRGSGNVVSGVVISGGMTMVNGRVVGGSSVPTVSAIEASVYLPAGSSLAAVSTSSTVEVFGYLERVEFRSVSGDLHLDGARQLIASSTSGDIHAGRVTERLAARTVSGDISIRLYDGSHAELDSTSGDIIAQATPASSGLFSASTVSGDIHADGTRHLRVNTHSVSGHVRTH
ncbi:DUF4097 domain-containing protein [Streptomyces sp. A7024]|uniref:DUF4097 domain-containing protein n=1 Tax=Streptomyces coryli TaxID=1128680 RepID=A0A6G4TYL3_9ACTN|nr:DUF4097 family beta strand repeat-containing protein [Streptomyces coryli]NGN64117.1 DUF4097 domain-containing protein [Streptomyces coryli]